MNKPVNLLDPGGLLLPNIVTIHPHSDFAPSDVQKKDYEAIKKLGEKKVSYLAAKQNIRASGATFTVSIRIWLATQ